MRIGGPDDGPYARPAHGTDIVPLPTCVDLRPAELPREDSALDLLGDHDTGFDCDRSRPDDS